MSGRASDDEETYYLLVTPHLERMLTQLSRPAPASQDTPLAARLCSLCEQDLKALGLNASGIHCPHAR